MADLCTVMLEPTNNVQLGCGAQTVDLNCLILALTCISNKKRYQPRKLSPFIQVWAGWGPLSSNTINSNINPNKTSFILLSCNHIFQFSICTLIKLHFVKLHRVHRVKKSNIYFATTLSSDKATFWHIQRPWNDRSLLKMAPFTPGRLDIYFIFVPEDPSFT